MPYFVGLLWGGFALILKSLIGRILIQLGISYVVYQGIDTLIDSLKSQALSHLSGIPADMIGIVGLTRIDQCMSVIISAVAAKYAINGLTGSGLTKIKLGD